MKTVISLILILIGATYLAATQAQAKADFLPKKLEKEILAMIKDLGPDSWEEGNIDAKFDHVLYDKDTQEVLIIFRTREHNSRKPFGEQETLVIKDIHSVDEIVEQAPNGFRSLNEKITDAIFDRI